ncbi:hypothetical protein GQX74_000431 [Glossina fuscipes]|nr:hypothetical protein GQX74_000431 [Glossina fuscipes]
MLDKNKGAGQKGTELWRGEKMSDVKYSNYNNKNTTNVVGLSRFKRNTECIGNMERSPNTFTFSKTSSSLDLFQILQLALPFVPIRPTQPGLILGC